jgi:malate/lactate dehydrogenase
VKLSRIGTSMADTQAGVAADIGHINTKSNVTGYEQEADGLKKALTGAEIVLIPAGVPRKPGMTRDGMRRGDHAIESY